MAAFLLGEQEKRNRKYDDDPIVIIDLIGKYLIDKIYRITLSYEYLYLKSQLENNFTYFNDNKD